VPRDSIAPPTRGFSILVASGYVTEAERAGAAPVFRRPSPSEQDAARTRVGSATPYPSKRSGSMQPRPDALTLRSIAGRAPHAASRSRTSGKATSLRTTACKTATRPALPWAASRRSRSGCSTCWATPTEGRLVPVQSAHPRDSRRRGVRGVSSSHGAAHWRLRPALCYGSAQTT
jgi:hypothetical protein